MSACTLSVDVTGLFFLCQPVHFLFMILVLYFVSACTLYIDVTGYILCGPVHFLFLLLVCFLCRSVHFLLKLLVYILCRPELTWRQSSCTGTRAGRRYRREWSDTQWLRRNTIRLRWRYLGGSDLTPVSADSVFPLL